MSVRVPITLACWDYDRTQALADGRIRPEGVDLTYLRLPVEETFFRMARYQEFDAAEMSLSSYVLSLFGAAPFVAIPVFPSRAFRHNGIYVRADNAMHELAQLRGKVVGVPEYQVTAAVWQRGILAEFHDVPVESVRYRTGGLHQPGRVEKIELRLPGGVEVEPIPADRTLTEMLLAGEIDALYSPRTPPSMLDGDRSLRRLLAAPRLAEEAYFAETGIFPIMHVIVLRREIYDQHRWLARSLFQAFTAAKHEVQAQLAETAATRYMLPWLYDAVEHTRRVMGADFWPYGLRANEKTLSTFLRYSYEQGLAERLLTPAELFAPESLETHRV
ncbi:ABC transporter substrate-binding protein [Fodinicola acaciae]|uniref:ABC transporter substrate-binding protein n=1 Tax=Fodinicola acaciae TaxID=2681555 RepID=UPI0013D47AD8|nr:ABC transporter substrate-binding protein [Fodinicola acaciae]